MKIGKGMKFLEIFGENFPEFCWKQQANQDMTNDFYQAVKTKKGPSKDLCELTSKEKAFEKF